MASTDPLLGSLMEAQIGDWKAEGREKLFLSCSSASGQPLLQPAGSLGAPSSKHGIPAQGLTPTGGQGGGQP